MIIELDKNHRLHCSPTDPLFQRNIDRLSDRVTNFWDKQFKDNKDTTDLVESVGNECQKILLTERGSNGDLFSEESYTEIFFGEEAGRFIEILIILQELWKLSSKLDTYSTLELIDEGIRDTDKQYFYRNIELLKNKLRLLENKNKKSES